ncbi:MAG: membrane dipeptidase [Myxococcota bacterium]|nr:membrane dipeptidase [Myxococcota bacterium]
MISNEARAVHDSALIIDLHCDLLLTDFFTRLNWGKRHRNPLPLAPLMGHCDIPRLKEGNIGALALGLVTNPLRRRSGPAAISRCLDRMDKAIALHPTSLARATTPATIRAARENGQIACFAGLEGAHGLDGRLELLEGLKARGLVYVGLVHFTKNWAARPMVGRGSSQTIGLTDEGRALVDALNTLGILVDVAHLNRPGVFEVCARSTAPVICSHTACTAVHSSPRCIDDAQIKAIADTGGVIGVIFVPAFIGPGGVDAVVAHLEHIRKIAGVGACAIGTDWEGWAYYPSDLDSAEKMPVLTEALLRRGWTPEEVLAAYGGNFMRVLEAL